MEKDSITEHILKELFYHIDHNTTYDIISYTKEYLLVNADGVTVIVKVKETPFGEEVIIATNDNCEKEKVVKKIGHKDMLRLLGKGELIDLITKHIREVVNECKNPAFTRFREFIEQLPEEYKNMILNYINTLESHYARKISLINEKEGDDPEVAHGDADEVLIELLELLGFDKVVREWEETPKWYS